MFWLRMGKNLGLVSKTKFEELIITKPIEKSGLFDKKWYLEQYPDVSEAQIDPVKHYLETGWKHGYNPSPRFDTNKYLSMYPDVDAEKICPLVHYINHGYNEGRCVQTVNADEESNINIQNICINLHGKKHPLQSKLSYFFEYPIRIQNKYNALKQEMERLNKM